MARLYPIWKLLYLLSIILIPFKLILTPITKLLKNRWFLMPAIIVILGFILFIALKSYIAPSSIDFSQRKEFIQLLAQILGGALLLIGLYLTWRRVEVAQEGQITERFTRAIDQLGSEKLEIRLGGIYALERIARDSKKDHWQIMEILTAYIRENAPWPSKGKKETSEKGQKSISPPNTDIQAILTVIARRESKFRKKETLTLDLSMTNLQKAALWRAHLEGAALVEAHLEQANLWDTHLEGASLSAAHLEEANLRKAHLEEAVLFDTHLEGASLSAAHLEKAYLLEAHLEGATLADTHLEEADLSNANLKKANLWKAHFEKADLRGTNLEEAYLCESHLEGADFRGTNLRGANLGEAIGLTKEQIESAIIDENTILPDYLKKLAKPKKRGKQEVKKKGTTSKRS